MKKILLTLYLFFTSLMVQNSYGQPVYTTGLYKSSKGTIKALAVFVQFQGDDKHPESTAWPIDGQPTFLNTFLDQDIDVLSEPWSFSDYYKKMSRGALKIYGNGYHVITQHPESYYSGYGEATREVLTTLDAQINFAEYDNWTFGTYSHTANRPDGEVDLIIMIYRWSVYPSGESAQGIAVLGYGTAMTLDGKTVNFGFPGSGLTNSGGWKGMPGFLISTKHEFGHILLGSDHPRYEGFTGGGGFQLYSGMWGIMPLPGHCANAYERERLGWITPITVTANTVQNLTDYVTTGMCLKIPIPGITNTFYYAENHRQLSIYDAAVDQINGEGLMIFKVSPYSGDHPTYNVEMADGKFDWANPYWIAHPFGGSGELPVFQKLQANRNGYDYRDYIPHTRPGFSGGKFEIFILDDDGVGGQDYYLFDGWQGNGNTGFRMNTNRVFAPWTNPGSGNDKNISVAILSDPGTYKQVRVDVGDITVTENSTIPGETFEFSGNLIVPNGVTLTILPGATLKFAAGKSLTAYGRLIANGTPASPITFTSTGSISPGSWGNIYLSGSGASGSSISFANIEYGTVINVINAPNVTISDCAILNSSSHGINFSGSTTTSCKALRNTILNTNIYHGIVVQNGAYVQCDQNKLVKTNSNHQGAAIYFLYGSTGTLWQNDIRGWNYGVGCYNASSPVFRNDPQVFQDRNNRITNCLKGIYAVINSWPTIGAPANGYNYNSIYSNTKNIYFTSGGELQAPYSNYWGYQEGVTDPQTTFYLGSGCSVNINGWSTTNWWGGMPLPKTSGPMIAEIPELSLKENRAQIGSFNKEGGNIGHGDESLFDGIKQRQEKGNKSARDFFKSYLAKHTDNQAVYVELYNCADEETVDDIIKYFSALPAKAAKEQESLLAYLYLRKGDIISAKAVNDRIFAKNKNSEIGARAKLSNFYIALYDENDVDKAISLYTEVAAQPKQSTPDELELAHTALETYPGISEVQRRQLEKITLAETAVPDHYELFQNYPNPFNPSTTIEYQIPNDGMVTMKVYDMLGREVITLVNEYKSVGRYTVTFDVNGLASGMYIYRLVSHTVEGGKKDAFTTAKKMMLVK